MVTVISNTISNDDNDDHDVDNSALYVLRLESVWITSQEINSLKMFIGVPAPQHRDIYTETMQKPMFSRLSASRYAYYVILFCPCRNYKLNYNLQSV